MENWNNNFKKLKAVYDKHHHFMTADKETSAFVANVFKAHKLGTLSSKEYSDLDSVDFDFTAKGKNWVRWWAKYQALIKMSVSVGISSISQLDKKIGPWISAQRVSYRQGTMSKKKILLLESIGFQWNPMEDKVVKWDDNLNRLKSFYSNHGNFHITADNTDPKFCAWVYAQRTAIRKKVILEKRKEVLVKIGFSK